MSFEDAPVRTGRDLVCPRCEQPVGSEQRFCGGCGLDLSALKALPVPADRLVREPSMGSFAQAGVGTAAMPSPTAEDLGRLRTRNRLLGSMSLAAAGGILLGAIGDILLLVDLLNAHALTGLSIAQGLSLVSDWIAIAGVSVAAAAFLGSGWARSSRLVLAAALLGGGFVLVAVGQITDSAIYAAHHANGTYIAANAVQAVSWVAVAVGLLLAAAAFARMQSARTAGWTASRDVWLGAASIVLAGGLLLEMVSSILALIAYSDAGATSGYTTGIGIAAGGQAIGVAAAVIAAVAFLNASQGQRRGLASWLGSRDTLLAVAMLTVACAFAIVAIGGMISSAAASANGTSGKGVAADWLDVFEHFALAAGATAASVGFFISKRAKDPAG